MLHFGEKLKKKSSNMVLGELKATSTKRYLSILSILATGDEVGSGRFVPAWQLCKIPD